MKSGRLIVGPWYSLPEEYVVNGESLVRNLVVGHRIADSLGACSKTGYTPFSYGQTSQIPQIYQGFDIDTIIFYRGITTPKSEFMLEGPDGSQLLGMRFGCMSRFSYYIYVYRVLRYGSDDVFKRYDWDRGAAPFRLANDGNPRAHYYVLDDQKKQWNDGPIREQLEAGEGRVRAFHDEPDLLHAGLRHVQPGPEGVGDHQALPEADAGARHQAVESRGLHGGHAEGSGPAGTDHGRVPLPR